MTIAYRAHVTSWWTSGPIELSHELVRDSSLNSETPSAYPSQTGPDDGVVDVVPGDTSTTFTVTVGGAGASGWISPVADRDWYAITLIAGQNYVFALSGSGGSPLQDTYLRLHNASGAQVAFDDDSGPGSYSLLSYAAPSSGTFYLDAGSFGDSSTGQYTLSASLVEGATDSIAASTATTSMLSVGTSAYGSVNTLGDHDWYGITLTAGQDYQFSLSGFDGSPLGNATLNLRDASGALIAEGNSSSVSSLVSFAAASSGVYYLDAGATNDASTGNYALSAGAYNGFVVNLIYDASALAAPQSFRDGIQAAANILQAMIADNITVNLNISYSGTGGGAFAGPSNGSFESYSQVRDLLINTAAPGDHTFDALPAGSTIGGQSQVVVWSAELRALGFMAANDPASDGSATFATDISPSLLVGVALHELTHALGRVQHAPQPDILEFFRFTSAGNYLFDDHTPASASSYFSIDGGVSRLANFGMSSDPSDFLNTALTANDSFNEFYNSHTLQNLTTTDLQVLDALGFHVFFASGADLIAQSATLTGSQFSFTIRNVGNAAAAASTAGVYLSADNTITTGDTLVITSATNALPSFGSDHDSVALAFTGAQAPGAYYLGAVADNGGSVTEGDETNNASNVVPIILGDSAANILTGTSGVDTVFALAGNDTLTGNGGNDTLIGGLGIDTANYASASTSDSWHRNLDGTWTIVAGSEGTDTLTGVEFAHFTDRDLFLARASETFTGDGASDLFLRNSSSGALSIWYLNGASITGAAPGSMAASFSVLGYGDLNGDGRDDILWRDSSGALSLWQMNGASHTDASPGNVSTTWNVAGVGDLNGDGRDDILWRNGGGDMSVWFMNADSSHTSASLGNVSPDWVIESFGDFNGDGKQDLLWRNTVSGDMSLWFMNGTSVTGGQFAHVGNPWVVEGTGDFNGDGRDDVLWRNSVTGDMSIWMMNGSTLVSQPGYSVGTSWHIAAIGDYNGDGKDDIIWWNDNGQLVEWLMNGGTITSSLAPGSLDHSWIINPGG